jgi:hypothetical protein
MGDKLPCIIFFQNWLGNMENPNQLSNISGFSQVRPNYDPATDLESILSNMSFSGADTVATMIIPKIGPDGEVTSPGDVIDIGEIQTISYSIHRENTPIRTLGHSNVRGFIKGSRTIAGSLIFTVFNEYAFYRIKQYREYLFAPLADMLPPFDIVLTFFNEYGNAAKMKLFGITIVDEGQTMSIDDLITEQTYTFMARGIQPMVHMAYEKEKYGDMTGTQANNILNINKNIFGDAENGESITAIYSNLLTDKIIS